jgi:hypothetical protein
VKAAKEAKKLGKGKGVSQEDSEQDDQKVIRLHAVGVQTAKTA